MSNHNVRGGPAATFQSIGFAEKVNRLVARIMAARHIQHLGRDWPEEDLDMVLESLGLPKDIMTEEEVPVNDKEVALAAAELIRAQDAQRELGRAGRDTTLEGRRVGHANDRLTVAQERRKMAQEK